MKTADKNKAANKLNIDEADMDELFEEAGYSLMSYAADLVLEQEGLKSI